MKIELTIQIIIKRLSPLLIEIHAINMHVFARTILHVKDNAWTFYSKKYFTILLSVQIQDFFVTNPQHLKRLGNEWWKWKFILIELVGYM